MKTFIRGFISASAILWSLFLFTSDAVAGEKMPTKAGAGTKAITSAATQVTTESGCAATFGNKSTTKVWLGPATVTATLQTDGGPQVRTTTGWPICSDITECFGDSVEWPGPANAVFAITTDGGLLYWFNGKSCQ